MRYASIAVTTAIFTAIAVTPATAAQTADTTVTFTVSATDGLNITAPSSAALSNTTPGGTASGPIGIVTVNDQRSTLDTHWTATVALFAAFTTGTQSGSETITGADVDYDPNGAISPVNGPFTPGTAGDLSSPRTAFSRPSGSGNNSVSWNPTLAVHVPTTAVAGLYTGTLRHSVA
ncbi:MAG: hypothetical protein QOF84_258 [Streptomyces sp.]|jgi:hypothetical protein|nr:hypothetical protein [Streptomyces sp.]